MSLGRVSHLLALRGPVSSTGCSLSGRPENLRLMGMGLSQRLSVDDQRCWRVAVAVSASSGDSVPGIR